MAIQNNKLEEEQLETITYLIPLQQELTLHESFWIQSMGEWEWDRQKEQQCGCVCAWIWDN